MKSLNDWKKELGVEEREEGDNSPSCCEYEAPQYYKYRLSDDDDVQRKALVFCNSRDWFYGLEFLNRQELDDFTAKLNSAADELWKKQSNDDEVCPHITKLAGCLGLPKGAGIADVSHEIQKYFPWNGRN